MLAKLFFSFLVIAAAAFGVEEKTPPPNENALASVEGEPSAMVAGCVYALSGEYCDSPVDLMVPGVEPLMLQRYYGGEEMGNWGFNLKSSIFVHNKERWFDITTSYGSKVYYKTYPDGIRVSERKLSKWVTNSSSGKISGKTNIKNNRIRKHGESSWELHSGDGVCHKYEAETYLLKKIKKPNLYHICFDYEKKKLKEVFVQRKGRADKTAWLTLKRARPHHYHLIASNGREVDYTYEEAPPPEPEPVVEGYSPSTPRPYVPRWTFKVQAAHLPEVMYSQSEYDEKYNAVRIEKKMPEGRYLNVDKYKGGLYHFGVHKFYSDSEIAGRVAALNAPAGTDCKPVLTHRFVYLKGKDQIRNHSKHKHYVTVVLDPYDHMTQYISDINHRLTCIKHFTGTCQHRAYCRERLYWGENDTRDSTNLLSRCFLDAKDMPFFCRHFTYDERGNILEDALWGNHSGSSIPLQMSQNGMPVDNGCERFVRRFSYSDDGLNLMTREVHADHEILYEYVKGTDYLSKKLVLTDGAIRHRAFYTYDVNGALAAEIVDDGHSFEVNDLSGVTERRIKRCRNTPSGMPEKIEMAYLELATGQERLLSRRQIGYDSFGQKIREEHFGSDGLHAYTLTWEYDAHGNAVKETNALGETTARRFDQNNNLLYEQGPAETYCYKYFYDFSNRLIRTEKVSKSRCRYTKTYKYNLNSDCVESTDWFGNATCYKVDEFGRVIKTTYPAVCDSNGQSVHPVERREYDPMGNVIAHVDPMGGLTRSEYTIRGKPFRICHSDGTTEQFVYNLKGDLVRHIGKNGAAAAITYDYLSRPVKKEEWSAQGELLSRRTFLYNAFHLLEETDPEGAQTKYRYDGAGRLIEVVKGESKTTTHYDALGRLAETREYDTAATFISKFYEYDLLNRVIEERTQAGHEVRRQVRYVYDHDGNRIQTITNSQAGTAVTTARYNILQEPVEVRDPLGNTTHTTRDDAYRNALGQHVCCLTVTDPLGGSTISIRDALGRIVVEERKSPFGALLHRREYFYDLCGRKVRQVETVTAPDKTERRIVNSWQYEYGRLAALVEAVGTPEQKTTRYTYTPWGQLEKLCKPDGVELLHSYDALGRLIELRSSDGTIQETYTYDCNSRLIEVIDRIHQTSTRRQYDSSGHLAREILGNGLSLEYTYDGLDRMSSLTLPDKTAIEYRYDGERLTSIQRGEYQHLYIAHDTDGSPLASSFAGQRIAATRDLLGRVTQLKGPHWRENLAYDAVGNLLKREVADPQGTLQCEYAYDDLYQLKSETGATPHRYVHDSVHNRMGKDGQEHVHNALNQLLRDGEGTYEYDLCGRLTRRQRGERSDTFSYDALDRLIEVRTGGRTYSYLYDFDHRRLSKSCGEDKELYFYQGANEIGRSRNGKIDQLRVLGVGKGAEIGAAVAMEFGGDVYIPLHDQSGHVVLLLDLRGQVVERDRYSAFGERLDREESLNPWKCSSKREDPETGWIYFGRRFYDPSQGRWQTPDPLGLSAGVNVYAYVMNNPLTHFDLYGLWDLSYQGSFSDHLDRPRESRSGSRDNVFTKIARWTGRALRALGDHMLPIPYVRDAISYIGHRLEGGCHATFYSECRNPASSEQDLKLAEVTPHHRVGCLNGMLNDEEGSQQIAKHISKQHGGTNVHYLYNSSHGFILDLVKSLALICGVRTRATMEAFRMIRTQIRKAGPEGTFTLYLHSQAGILGHQAIQMLTPHERSQLNVITLGSAKLIGAEGLGRAMNYVNTRDIVPALADPIGYAQALFSQPEHVRFLQSHTAPFVDHAVLGDNYRGAIERESKIWMNLIGGIK